MRGCGFVPRCPCLLGTAAGADLKAIFKEPTITPTEIQKKELGLKQAWGSPNGAMRRGWNGITIRCACGRCAATWP